MVTVEDAVAGLSQGARRTLLHHWGDPGTRAHHVLVTETMEDRTYQELIDAGLLEPWTCDPRDYWPSDLGLQAIGALIELRGCLEAQGDLSLTTGKRLRWYRKVVDFAAAYGMGPKKLLELQIKWQVRF